MSIEHMAPRVDEAGNVHLPQPKIVTRERLAERTPARVGLIDRVADSINNFFDGQAPAELAPAVIEAKPEKVSKREERRSRLSLRQRVTLGLGTLAASVTAIVPGAGIGIATAQSAEEAPSPVEAVAQTESTNESDWWDNFPTIDGQRVAFQDMPVVIQNEITDIEDEQQVDRDDATRIVRRAIRAATNMSDQAARVDYSELAPEGSNYFGPRLDQETVEDTVADLRERSQNDAKVLATLAYELREADTGDQLLTENNLDEVNRFAEDLDNDPELRRAIHAYVWDLLDASDVSFDQLSGPTRSVYVNNGEILSLEKNRDGAEVIVFVLDNGRKVMFVLECGGQSVEPIEEGATSQPETPVVETPPETPEQPTTSTTEEPTTSTTAGPTTSTTVGPTTTTTQQPTTTTTQQPTTTTTQQPTTTTAVTHPPATTIPDGVIIENQNTSNNTASSITSTRSNW